MSRQDKTTTERHAKTLRELVKKPDNKMCADCKRHDARWASWNLGVFLCIRCSGIHRGMGTHISKVKSVDLDVWTPEQMESILKWGNHRANLYWEAHLRPGHVPPEHKMESFVRSKYETRRWAMEGPPPTDPSVLEQAAPPSNTTQSEPEPQQPAAPAPRSRPTHGISGSISNSRPAPPVTTRQPQPHQLLSANFTKSATSNQSAVQSEATTTVPGTKGSETQNDLFSLDFHAPPASTAPATTGSLQQPKKDVKQDILSLFSTPSPAAQTTNPMFNTLPSPAATPWTSAPVVTQPSTSMMGTAGVGAWGTSSGWTGTAAAPTAQPNLWATPGTTTIPAQNSSLFNTSDVWSTPGPSQHQTTQDLFSTPATTTQANKKDDVFGDLWGDFK
ncbi:hypothetical protein AX17_001527 [Amanita inopinata Kibby_2008]|nr:hypothetical protein AX17_001527 [Amanita inopinata Kibby_2008]